jgi:flagellar basal body P-ring protein FlgI
MGGIGIVVGLEGEGFQDSKLHCQNDDLESYMGCTELSIDDIAADRSKDGALQSMK